MGFLFLQTIWFEIQTPEDYPIRWTTAEGLLIGALGYIQSRSHLEVTIIKNCHFDNVKGIQ